jgi:hypothetical protein
MNICRTDYWCERRRLTPAEAINRLNEKARRLAHGYRNFTNYRLRMLLAAGGTRPYRRTS